MKIKSEPPDGDSGGSESKPSPEKEKKRKTPKHETGVKVKAEPSDRHVKQEITERKYAPTSAAVKQSVSDITTHIVKSEVKLEASAGASTSSSVRKRSSKRKKKVTRRKSTTKRKVTKKKKTVRKIGRKKVRKAKTVTRSSRGIVSDVRARLAAKIGLTKKKSLGPHSLPLINKPTYELAPVRSDLLPALSLLGQGLPVTISAPVSDEFDPISDMSDVTAVTSRRSLFTRTRLTDLKAGLIPDPLRDIRQNSDLLGSILERQDVLLARSQDIVVSYDGTLKLNCGVPVRRHTSTTNDAGDQKTHKSPPPSDQNSNGHGAGDHTNNQDIDPESNNPNSNSSHFSNGKEHENVTLVRSSLPACGMPLKKRKFESHDNVSDSADSKLPPIERLNLVDVKAEPVTDALSGMDPETRESIVTKANKEADSVSSSASAGAAAAAASDSTSSTLVNDCVHDKKSIEVKLELETSEARVKEEPPGSSSNEVEVGSQTAEKVKRCRHGKVVRDKSSKVTKSDNHRDVGREKDDEKDRSASKTRPDSHSKSNGADETKRRVSVRSEVRDKSSTEKRLRSEDRSEKSHRTQKKKNDDVWMENTDRRTHHNREDVDRDRSRSCKRTSHSREQSDGRRSSRHEEEKGTRKGSHNLERYDDAGMEHERSRKHRHHHHHHRITDRQHKEDVKPVVKDIISERDPPHMDSNLLPDSKIMHSKSKAPYDKVGGDSLRHVNSESRSHTASRRMSGPKTPPDVRMRYLNAFSHKSPPTPTMDEADGPAVTSANGSMPHHTVNRRPVSSRVAVQDKVSQSDGPLFASPTKVTTNVSSWIKQFTRPDASSRPSHHVPAAAIVPREAEGEKELDSGTNQVAIQQFLQSMLPKSKSVESPASDAAYSPGGPLADSPRRNESTSSSHPISANQSLIDQILKFAQQTQQSSASASTTEAGPEDRKKQLSSGHKAGASGASADDANSKEKYLDKLNRQERVIEEVKLVLKPFYQRREVTKFEYKEIMRKAVPKVCHNKTQEINPSKIKGLVEKYIKQVKADRTK